MSQALTLGVHHVGLSVPDLPAAERFFVDALGFKPVGGVPDYPAVFVSDGTVMLTLWRVADPATAAGFDRRENVGLHHLALKVPDDAALDRAFQRVAAHEGVTVEFAPGPVRAGAATRHCIVAIPGGVRLELIAA
jgi:catechol 2,3-dioxygenase-like lactoylglutathione lyase family enzyme